MTAETASDRFTSVTATAGQTVLAYDFRLTAESALRLVRIRDGVSTVLSLGDDYAFPFGLGTDDGGTLALTVGAYEGDIYQMVGLLPETRASDFLATQAFLSEKFNADLDRLTLIAQEHRRDIDRSLKLGFGEAISDGPAPAANLILGWNADGTAIENKAPVDLGLETLPAAAQAYLRRNAGNTGFEAMSPADVWSDLSATRGFNQAATGQFRETLGARYHRVADILRLGGQAIQHNGEPENNGGTGGFLWDDTGGLKADGVTKQTTSWMEQATISSTSGIVGEDGNVAVAASMKGAGVAHIAFLWAKDDTLPPTQSAPAWATYEEIRRDRQYTSTWIKEGDSVNFLPSPATGPYDPYGHKAAATGGAGTTHGIMIAAGAGGTLVAPLMYDSDVALVIARNGAKWWTGLSFLTDALVPDAGTGTMHAIKLGYNQAIEMHEFTDGGIGMSLVSIVTDAAHRQALQFANNGASLVNAAGKTLFRAGWAANAVNGISTLASATGVNPTISAIGDDANLDLLIVGKGSGGGRLGSGGGATSFRWNSAGLAFHGAAPVAKQAIAGALSTVTDAAAKAVLTSIISALSTTGFATNSTT